MKTIKTLIKENGFHKELQIRYYGWQNIKYFKIDSIDEDFAHGFLDNGEKASYPIDADFWEVYFQGAESSPLAV